MKFWVEFSLHMPLRLHPLFFIFSCTVIKYEVDKEMNVKANQFPFDGVSSCPMESIAQLANGTCGICRCIGCIYILLSKNRMHN